MAFFIKHALTALKFRDIEHTKTTDQKLGAIIRNFSYDKEEVAKSRKQTFKNLPPYSRTLH